MKQTKEQLLLLRVFKAISYNYFEDHKMIEHYCRTEFPRQLGSDIADYIATKNPKYFNRKERESNESRR